MRSLSRWSSLVPQSRSTLPHNLCCRTRGAAHLRGNDKVATIDTVRWTGAIAEQADKENSAQRVEGNAAVKKKSTKGKEKGNEKEQPQRFKGMTGKSMEPANANKDVATSSSSNEQLAVTACGFINDRRMKPLTDYRKMPKAKVPKLAHGLETVLSRPGVHLLKDPDTKEYNFDQYLEDIPKVHHFAFERLGGFVPSSQDKKLIKTAREANCKYVGSTSSLTGMLVQIYLLLSEEKSLDISNLSEEFEKAPRFFTPGQRIPTSVILNYQDGIYTTDCDSSVEGETEEPILLPLGTLLEKFLTLHKDDFGKFLRTHTEGDHPPLKDVHRYARRGKFLMRSQLDCIHSSLPGTGVFDLKTRAISPVRHDVYNYLNYIDHGLNALTGREGSFEQEYYDMIRSAFLEYSFQARIGNMDGIMVAYHNTARIFGFQYISLLEMDKRLFGLEGAGDRVFLRCVYLLEVLYDHIVKSFKKKSVKCTFEKRGHVLRVWVEPLEHSDPKSEPPVVELVLSLQNIVDGKATKGFEAVTSTKRWSIKYEIQKLDQPQEQIRERRERAHRRQMYIAHSLPEARDGGQAEEGERDEALVSETASGELLVESEMEAEAGPEKTAP